MSFKIILLIFIPVLLIASWIYKRKRHMSLLSRHGIPGPKPHLIFGNLFHTEIGRPIYDSKVFTNWFKKYGPIVGFYYGYTPMVIVDDPDFYKQVMVKDFSDHPNRMPHFPTWTGDPKERLSVMFARDADWKRLRSSLTPIFSSSKLKSMFPLLEQAADVFITQLTDLFTNQPSNKCHNIHPPSNKLVLDFIARTAFRLSAPIQTPCSRHSFVRAADTFVSSGPLMTLGFCLPELDRLINSLRWIITAGKSLFGIPALWYIYTLCRASAKQRREAKEQHDLLDLMLNIKSSGGEGAITDEEIEANATMFIVAGYEATGSTLSLAIHTLTVNEELQEKCYQEVVKVVSENPSNRLDFADIAKLDYLESVILESMRIYPPTTNFIIRSVEKHPITWSNHQISAGACIMVPLHHFHHRADLFPDPDNFHPERWSKEKRSEIKTAAFQPFGLGPRNCIANHYALVLMKYALARMVIRFRLVPGAETEVEKATADYSQFDTQPMNGVWIRAVLREEK